MARKAIKARMKADYQSLYAQGGYQAVGVIWDISGGMVWRMINEPKYWPTDKIICQRLKAKAREFGIVIRRRGRKRDLFSMNVNELQWRLNNRVEIETEEDKND